MKHISEEKIQSYLDEKLQGLTREELEHVDSCAKCRSVIADYKRLYGELDRDESIKLSADFVKDTMKQIMAQESAAPKFNFATVLWILGAAACVAAIIYTIDIKALLDGAGSFMADGGAFGSSATAAIKQWIIEFRHSLSIVLAAGMILVAVALVDRVLLRQKLNKAYLFSV